jgi:uncharacterized protein (TIGR02996 family)
MEEHEPFIAAIEAEPNDHTTRLVYADFLDDRDDPAGEYLRTELQLASLPEGSELAPDLRANLRTLRSRIEPAWLARFDQPRVMLANPTPFPAAWWGLALPGIRDFEEDFRRFPYDTLPPLSYPPFNGSFDWLSKPSGVINLDTHPAEDDAAYRTHLARLVPHLTDNGLTAPSDFLRLMTDQSVRRILSCVGCYPKRPWDATLAEGPSGSRVLPFYFDMEDCITWYLYLTPEGYHAVVAGRTSLCNHWYPVSCQIPDLPLDIATSQGEAVDFDFVAPTVEAFFYRWWLEKSLRLKSIEPGSYLHDPTLITTEEQAYMDFYRQHPLPTPT